MLGASASRLASALPDFAAPVRLIARTTAPERPAELPAAPAPLPLPPMVTEAEIQQRIAAAVRDAQEATARELADRHAENVRAIEADHARAIASVETELGGQLGSMLAARFDQMERHVEELTVAVAARLLGGFLSDQMRDRAIGQLALAIRTAIGDSDAVLVTVRGPQSLYEPLAAALGPRSAQLVFAEGPGHDLAVAVDDVQFETRIAEWGETIAGIMA